MKISTALDIGSARHGNRRQGEAAPTLGSAAIALRENGPPVPGPVEPGALLWAVAINASGRPAPVMTFRWHLDGVLVAETRSFLATAPGTLAVTIRLDNGVSPAAEATSHPVTVAAAEHAGNLPLAATGADVSLWTGAVTATGITATARVSGAGETHLVVSPDETFATQICSEPLTPHADYRFARATIGGLQPGTAYYLRTAVDGVIDTTRPAGRFRTPPAGAHSFSFAAASCARTGSNLPVFDRIREADCDFFVHLGDMHYADIAVNDEALFHAAYDSVFAAARQNAAWRSLPTVYMWDDHDYGPNDSDASSPSRPAAVAAYRRRVPVPLADEAAGAAVYYSFTRGRVRFVVTDLRSERSPKGAADNADKIVLGAAQKAWFEAELAAARDSGQFVCWVNTLPWATAPSSGSDNWGGYTNARNEIAGIINAEGMADRLFAISGDMHALAYVGPAENPVGGWPICHAAPLDQSASHKLAPSAYTLGPVPGTTGASVTQYGLIEVEDSGGATISVTFRGRTVSSSGIESQAFATTFSRSLPQAPAFAESPAITPRAEGDFDLFLGASTGSPSAAHEWETFWNGSATPERSGSGASGKTVVVQSPETGAISARVTVRNGVGSPVVWNSAAVAANPGSKGYFAEVLSDTPIFVLNEVDGGLWRDHSGSGRHAALGSSNVVTTWAQGTALWFNGTINSRLQVPAVAAIADGAPWAMEVWLRYNYTTQSRAVIEPRSPGVTGGSWFGFFAFNSGRVGTWMTDQSNMALTELGSGLNNNEWHHFVAQLRADGTIELFIDGALAGSRSKVGSSFVSAAPVFLGGMGQRVNDRYFSGHMAAPAMYTHALSSERILAHYNAGVP